MNVHTKLDELSLYQVRRLKELIEEMLQCCHLQTESLSRKFEMPQAELRCLLLFRGERYLTVKTIARRLDVAKSRVTKIIEGLLKKRLVVITDDPNDARIKLIRLTHAGNAKCEEMGQYIWNTHERLLMEIDPDRRKSVISSLDLLRVCMESVKKGSH
ncbi:MAG: MarR family winged helix-turn-helix transcriptional regulator [Syntrophobacteraceae bacterium]